MHPSEILRADTHASARVRGKHASAEPRRILARKWTSSSRTRVVFVSCVCLTLRALIVSLLLSHSLLECSLLRGILRILRLVARVRSGGAGWSTAAAAERWSAAIGCAAERRCLRRGSGGRGRRLQRREGRGHAEQREGSGKQEICAGERGRGEAQEGRVSAGAV